MTMKFKPTIADKFKTMNNDMIAAREQKKKELVEKYVPESVKEKLTDDEVDKSASAGFFIGLVLLLALIAGVIAWWFFR